MNNDILKKYAYLLVHYSLYLKKGERLYISSTTLAEPLINEIFLEATKIGVIVEVNMSLAYQADILLNYGMQKQLEHVSVLHQYCIENFDAYLAIRAPFPDNEMQHMPKDKDKSILRRNALESVQQTYFRRLGDGTMKRSLCQYPTQYNADLADMTLDEYSHFVFNACHLYADNPSKEWEKLSIEQQKIADFLNQKEHIRYKNANTDISFSVKGRQWINSDGKNNMPSGEVFSSPVEDSVNGKIHFDFPSIYNHHEVNGVTLVVEQGEVVSWEAEKGNDYLDTIFEIEGSRYFGEVAIGNNYNVQRATKNILFDEKIGGTVHMAIGQSYIQTGGKNKSTIHWDLIADMKTNGEIYADDELIYKNGKFIF